MAKATGKAARKDEAAGRLMGVREAAEYLGISTWSMRARMWAGDVPFVQFPNCRRLFLDARDLEEMIRNNKIITDY